MEEPQIKGLWRILLRDFCQNNPSVKDDLAKQLDIKRRALDKWIEAGSQVKPDDIRIRKLPFLVPGHEAEMRLSLESAYPSAFEAEDMDILPNIPATFYERLLAIRAYAAKSRRCDTLLSTAFRQIAGHIDPDGSGIVILFARCLEENGKVHYLELEKGTGYGTNQWMHQQIIHPFRIGQASLCAQAVLSDDTVVATEEHIPNARLAPILYAQEINSCAACNVSFSGDVSGALFIGAKEHDFFTAERCLIIQHYANALALAFEEREFYPREHMKFLQAPDYLAQAMDFHAQQLRDDLRQQYPHVSDEQIDQRASLLFLKGEMKTNE